ncbi:MAG: virulence protein [Verrucomicrobia bacterium]|nr:virulence protein [Verrucomicrobiota bacterium]MCH8513110.1 glycoside hydrolase family 55 protein [Kiritimatiellia bacterium]
MKVIWLFISMAGLAAADGIRFPGDAGVLDVTRAPFNAKGDGVADDTLAIQAALNFEPNGNRIVYLPNGIYRVRDTLRWPDGAHGHDHKRTILQGQSREGVVIRLDDASPGFNLHAGGIRAVIWTGPGPAQRFRNAVRDLTVDTGRNNPWAAGIQFMANNQGTLRNVTIRSGDGSGKAGLDLRFTTEIGPMYVRDVEIIGFERGIWTNYDTASITFENIELRGQTLFGFHNRAQKCFIRNLVSRNAVTAVYNEKDSRAHMVIDGAELHGEGGAAGLPAILNEKNMVVRNLRTRGYAMAIRHDDKGRGNQPGANGPEVGLWISHGQPHSLFSGQNLPPAMAVRDAPAPEWHPLEQWASPLDFGGRPNDGQDDTAAIQRAVDSGASTVYLPNGTWQIDGEVVLRGAVTRFLGTEARLNGSGTLRVERGTGDHLILERLAIGHREPLTLLQDGDRTLVVSSVSGGRYARAPGATGDLFIEDWVVDAPLHFAGDFHIWARQLNQETDTQGNPDHPAKVVNDGARLWVLGYKTERAGTVLLTRNGGHSEIVGAFIYATGAPKTEPMIRTENAVTLLLGVNQLSFNNRPFPVFLEETQGPETRTLSGEDERNILFVGGRNP